MGGVSPIEQQSDLATVEQKDNSENPRHMQMHLLTINCSPIRSTVHIHAGAISYHAIKINDCTPTESAVRQVFIKTLFEVIMIIIRSCFHSTRKCPTHSEDNDLLDKRALHESEWLHEKATDCIPLP